MRCGLLVIGWLPALAAGCAFVPQSTITALETQNRALSEQNKAHTAELANLRAHTKKIEDQLLQAERQLAGGPGSASRTTARAEPRGQLVAEQPTGSIAGQSMSPAARRLEQLTQRHRVLRFDPQTGVCKLEDDVLFGSGDATLSPQAQRQLKEFAAILTAAEGHKLRVMVVGHTDDRSNAAADPKQRSVDPWQLATERALAVTTFLREQGLREQQVGMASFGRHQPVASNADEAQRRLNRRVELFIMSDDLPIVGWTETLPTLY